MNVLEARRRLLGRNVYKRTTEGNPAIAQGSLARMYPGITMQGWTEQESTTGAQLFDQSLAEDNKYQNFDINSNNFSIVQNDEYWITGKIPVKPNTTYTINVNAFGAYYSDADTPITTTVEVKNPFTTPENANYVCLNVKKSNYQFGSDIMLNEGSTALPWEPYTGGKPSPSPDYPQEIVSTGKYNEDTQKWEYEITIANEQTDPDKNQIVTLTADRPLTKWDNLEKRNGQWGWVYGSVEADMSSEVTWVIHPGYEQETSNLFRGAMSGVDEIDSTDMVLCNILPYRNVSSADVNGIYSLSNYFFARIVGIKSLEDFQEKIQGGKVLTKLSTETFIPLTESEQESMNALYTFRPTTVLSNDAGCNMELTYKTKKSLEVTT